MSGAFSGRLALVGAVLLAVTGPVASGQKPKPAAPAADSITPQLIALGDSVFHGRVAGGTCAVCHGADGKGTPGLAPDLTDAKWLHSDGGYAAIVRTVEQGVPEPKDAPAPMPAMGGIKLTPEQIRAVAAYVYWLSHPEARRSP